MEFTEEQWRGLADHARARGILFISSPFSLEAVDLLERVGMPLWKIPSGETSNPMLLDRILDTGAPVLLSTGMSPVAEIDAAVQRVKDRGVAGRRVPMHHCIPLPAGEDWLEPDPRVP
jgi:N-acetylneuraminate synthase